MKEYEKYLAVKGDYKNQFRYGYDFPIHSLCTNRYFYEDDIKRDFNDLTPDLTKYVKEFFEDNPRREFVVVKDLRYFYNNPTMRKLMRLNDELYECKTFNFPFKITEIQEASNSSCLIYVYNRINHLEEKQIELEISNTEKILDAELKKLNLKAKTIKRTVKMTSKNYFGENKPGFGYCLKILVGRR